MTEIISGGRYCGKSSELVRRSAATGIYILVVNRKRAEQLADLAQEMGLYIPFPVTIREYFEGNKFRGSSLERDGIYIDDVDDIVKSIFSTVEIKAVTFTTEVREGGHNRTAGE